MECGRGLSSSAGGLKKGLGRRRMCGGISVFDVLDNTVKLTGGSGLDAEGWAGLREADGSMFQATGTLGEKTEEEGE